MGAAASDRAVRERRLARGDCTRCGQRKHEPNHTKCGLCLYDGREERKRKREGNV